MWQRCIDPLITDPVSCILTNMNIGSKTRQGELLSEIYSNSLINLQSSDK